MFRSFQFVCVCVCARPCTGALGIELRASHSLGKYLTSTLTYSLVCVHMYVYTVCAHVCWVHMCAEATRAH